jgi:competence protein ComEA
VKLSYAFTGGALGIAALATLWRAHAPPPAALQIAAGPTAARIPARPFQTREASASPDGRMVVYVAGEVLRPGLYRLGGGTRIDDAIRAAGGFTSRGDRLTVDLAEPLTDGEEVLVAPEGAIDPYAAPARRSNSTSSRSSRSRARTSNGYGRRRSRSKSRSRRGARATFSAADLQPLAPVDVNVASEDELQQLPGIGPGLAQRIVEFRQLNGPFASTTDLLDVAGMTDRKLDAVDAYIVLGPGERGRR